jgi:hypothetical protein
MIIGIGVANLANLLFVWPVMHRLRLLDLKLDAVFLLSMATLTFVTSYLN